MRTGGTSGPLRDASTSHLFANAHRAVPHSPAVNGYLREAVLARSGPNPGGADYEPRPRTAPVPPAAALNATAALGDRIVLAAASDSESEAPALALPPALWEQILQSAALAPADICSAGLACRALREAAGSEAIWERLFLARWGCVPGAPAEGGTWCAKAPSHLRPSIPQT